MVFRMFNLSPVRLSEVVVNYLKLMLKFVVVIAVLGWCGCGEGIESQRESAVSSVEANAQRETKMPQGNLQRDASDDVPEQESASAGSGETGGTIPADASTEDSRQDASFYSVAQYDEKRDPTVDLAMTKKAAQKTQKRILIQVGGDWCNWCGRLAEVLVENAEIRSVLEENFLLMKVASQTKYSDAFLTDYPRINSYPHLFVLSAKGELLHSQDMEEMELGEGYDKDALLEFFEAWVSGVGNGVPGELNQATQ